MGRFGFLILKSIKNITDDNDRAHLYLRLLEYCDAKRKAIEVTIKEALSGLGISSASRQKTVGRIVLGLIKD